MSDTQVLIFSKERTLQLNSLIKSLLYFSDLEEKDISILFKSTKQISYDKLSERYDCHFFEEISFLNDVKNIIQTNGKKYCMFLVDDLIIRDYFSVNVMESTLSLDKSITAFSLRLGTNIADGMPPGFKTISDSVLTWDTNKSYGKSWNYIWELSSSMYRIDFVNNYLKKCDSRFVDFPNPLESHYYGCYPSQYVKTNKLIRKLKFLGQPEPKGMACFKLSKAFTQGVNLVANRNINYKDLYSPLALHKKFLNGYGIDYLSLSNILNKKPNAGTEHFKLIKYEE